MQYFLTVEKFLIEMTYCIKNSSIFFLYNFHINYLLHATYEII